MATPAETGMPRRVIIQVPSSMFQVPSSPTWNLDLGTWN
jgi:hypothetical protein